MTTARGRCAADGFAARLASAIRRHPLVCFGIIFFAARAPFLVAGYGADTDAYRVALSARYLWSTGEYLPSRLPGNPLHDLATALLITGGPVATNIATTIAAFLGVLVFDRIVVALGVPGRWWLLVAMGFTPWLLVTSTATLDYHWALTAMLAAYLASIRGRFALAGALLGVAVGYRITAGAFLLPLSLLVLQTSRSRHAGAGWRAAARPLVEMTAATVAVSLLAFAPVLWTYGTRFWNYAPSSVSPDVVIRLVGQRALGATGAIVAVAVLAISWRRLAHLPGLLGRDPHVLLCTITVVIYTALFLRLPIDAGYLIPIYPFAFLLVARILARWALMWIVVVTLLGGVADLDIQGLHNFDPRIAGREVRPSWRVATLADDYRMRTRWHRFAEAIPQAGAPPHSVVLTLGAFPDVAVLHWDDLRYAIVERDRRAVSMLSDNGSLWDDRRDVVYLAVADQPTLDRFRTAGYTVYRATPDGPSWRVHIEPVE